MGEFSPIRWLILLAFIVVGVLWLAYWHGKKVGNKEGYIKGYKDKEAHQNEVYQNTIDCGTSP